MMHKENQTGRSMIEMLGVLAIVGVLSVGGIAGYSKAMNHYRINKTIEQISQIIINTRNVFATQDFKGQRNYSGINNVNTLKKTNIIPDEMWNGNEIKTLFGTNVVLNSSSSSASITLQSLDPDACIGLATKDWSNLEVSYLVVVSDLGGWTDAADFFSAFGADWDGRYAGSYMTGAGTVSYFAVGNCTNCVHKFPMSLSFATEVCQENSGISIVFK